MIHYNVGESSCNSRDATGQMAQPLMFMMMMMMMMMIIHYFTQEFLGPSIYPFSSKFFFFHFNSTGDEDSCHLACDCVTFHKP